MMKLPLPPCRIQPYNLSPSLTRQQPPSAGRRPFSASGLNSAATFLAQVVMITHSHLRVFDHAHLHLRFVLRAFVTEPFFFVVVIRSAVFPLSPKTIFSLTATMSALTLRKSELNLNYSRGYMTLYETLRFDSTSHASQKLFQLRSRPTQYQASCIHFKATSIQGTRQAPTGLRHKSSQD